jgi:hypothetical protein
MLASRTIRPNQLALVQLPSAAQINKEAETFIDSVRSGNRSVSEELSKTILGKLSPSMYEKPHWLIVADGPVLSSVPFAALPFPKASGKQVPLCLDHTIRFLPSERLVLSRWGAAASQTFVGIADPIYNHADPR